MATLVVTDGGTSPEYSSLNAALAAAGTGDTISIEGTWSSADTTAATIADDNITITTDADSKHPGYVVTSSPDHYRLECSSGSHCITVSATGTTIDGLVIKQASTTNSAEGIRISDDGSTTTVKNSIIWASNPNQADQDGIYSLNISRTLHVENTQIYGFNRAGIHVQNTAGSVTTTTNVNSCTIVDNGRDARSGAEAPGGIGFKSAATCTHTVNVFNSIVMDNDSGTGAADFNEAATMDGTRNWNISYSIDSDNSIATYDSGGTGNLASRVARDGSSSGGDEVIFTDYGTVPYDLRLVDDATNNDAQDAHSETGPIEGLSLPTLDIAGNTRDTGTNEVDIGCHAVVDAVTASAPPNNRFARSLGSLMQY